LLIITNNNALFTITCCRFISEDFDTIYLRAVDQDGDKDSTPATWSFTIVGKKDDKDNDKVTHKDIIGKIEDSENDVIKQIQGLWDWLRDLVAGFAKALGGAAAAAEERKK
jgi:hypothetical protein